MHHFFLSNSHLPSHSSREILIIFGSLTTCDPGNVHDTVEACVKDKIRVSVVALAAEMRICHDFSVKTGGMLTRCHPCVALDLGAHRQFWRRTE